MRIRSIKPEFWRSEDVAGLPIEDRLLFIGLWSYVDDNGVGRDVEAIILAELFALDDFSESSVRVQYGLSRLQAAGLITRYEVDGKRYLRVRNWERHQRINRPSPPRYPLPTCGNTAFNERSVSPQNMLGAGTEEQRNRGTGEQGSSSPSSTPPSSVSTSSPIGGQGDADRGEVIERVDVERVCQHLAERIVANGARQPSITATWRKEARLLLDKDAIDESEIHAVIDWCTADSFWKANILSLPKLRKQFDTLKLQMRGGRGQSDGTLRGAQAARAVMNVDVGALAARYEKNDREILAERVF